MDHILTMSDTELENKAIEIAAANLEDSKKMLNPKIATDYKIIQAMERAIVKIRGLKS